MPLERAVVNAVRKEAGAMGWLTRKIHGGVYGLAGWPDLMCLKNGELVFIEAKQPGKKPRPLQIATMRTIEQSTLCPCGVCTSGNEARDFLMQHDLELIEQALTLWTQRVPVKDIRKRLKISEKQFSRMRLDNGFPDRERARSEPVIDPTPDEIEAECAKFRAGWSRKEERRRRIGSKWLS